MKKYKTVDLFAGAGGLSLGFSQTGKFDIKVAFENNLDMQKTYKKNHPNVDVMGDVCTANYNEIKRKYGNIDVVIGGPPCQGFSNANRQKSSVISKNNMLVKEYIRAIVELQPKAFVMENVSMLCSDTHRFFISATDRETINKYHIPCRPTVLSLLDEKYIFDGVLNVIQNQEQITQYLWDSAHYAELNIVYKCADNTDKLKATLEKHKAHLLNYAAQHKKNNNHILRKDRTAFMAIVNYFDGKIDNNSVKGLIEPAIMLQRMLMAAKEIYDNQLVVDEFNINGGLVAIIQSYAIIDYIKHILESDENGYIVKDNVLCAAEFGVPQRRNRFVAIGIKKCISEKFELPVGTFENYRTVKDALFDIEDVESVTDSTNGVKLRKPKGKLSELATMLRDSDILYNHIITKTTAKAQKRFDALEPGDNFHSLDDELKDTYSNPSRTQNTIYLKLLYTEPSGTVVNVRKSMWVHPSKNRAISVREAARLQTFPDSFVFEGTKDRQYQQVGNAVPPMLAKAIAEQISDILHSSKTSKTIKN